MATPGNDRRADAVRAYHDDTSHRPYRLAPGPGRLDWANQPDPFRRYPGAPEYQLPFVADELTATFADIEHVGNVPPAGLDRQGIGALFELALGLSAWKSYRGNTWALRCNPSSGNLHPTEGYLVCPSLPDLPAGVHHYAPRDHLLERRLTPAAGWDDAFPPETVLIGLSSIHWREAWKYGSRAFRYCELDVGHALGALRYAAAVLGWRARLVTGVGDDTTATLLGLGDEGPEAEVPDALLAVATTATDCAQCAEDLASGAAAGKWFGTPNTLSPEHVHWSAVDRVAAATVRPEDDIPPATPSEAAEAPLPPRPCPVPAAGLIRGRRSAMAFDGRTAMSADAFFALCARLRPRPDTTPLDVWPWSPAVHPVFWVHRVDGLEPGLYTLPRRPQARAALRSAMRDTFLWESVSAAPEGLGLDFLLPMDLREVAAGLSCQQDIAGDSAFAVSLVAEFGDELDTAPWHYRDRHREAGLLGQVLYLEAEAAGLRGTGIGCFFDDEVHRALGVADERHRVVYHFTCGGAVDDPRLSTLPPYANGNRVRAD